MKLQIPSLLKITPLLFSSFLASAQTEFNQDVNPEVIFGSGNANGSFTTSRNNGVELGLRAKIAGIGNVNSTGDGRYYYSLADSDHDGNPSTPNQWNFDWTVNTDFDSSNGTELNAYTYELGLDVDPSSAKNFLIFDPVTPTNEVPFFDHSIGNNTTGNGGGVEATDELSYFDLLFTQNVLQQSWRYEFFDKFPPMDTYDPSVTGTYHIYLLIRNDFGSVVARTEIVVIIIDDRFVTPEIIFGSGNANGQFTVDTGGDVEIGLRAKIPYDGNINYNGDGTYSYSLDETVDPDGEDPKRWNFDWTINTDFNDPNSAGDKISDYTYEMGLDADPSLETDFFVFDPVTPNTPPINTPIYDHAFGDNNTANGGGTVATDVANYNTLYNSSNVLQQSWRYAFFSSFSPLDTFNPDIPGSYIVYLLARNKEGQVVARDEIQILIEGAPKRTVPVAIDDSFIIFEDSTIAVPDELGLLSNDADADMDDLTVLDPGTFAAGGIGGLLLINADGSYEYTPPANANGTATFQYKLTDGYYTVTAMLEIIVKARNDQPTFSIFGDFIINELEEDSSTFIIENFIFDFDPGPFDEMDQIIESIDIEVVSDSDNVLNEVFISNSGTLFFDLNLNFGTAMLEVTVKDSGDVIGNAFSDPVPFFISYLDLIFANGFDSTDDFNLLSYLGKLTVVDQENQAVVYEAYKPYYDFPSNSINFMGHRFKLENDYNSRKLIMALSQWMDEVINSENLPVLIK